MSSELNRVNFYYEGEHGETSVRMYMPQVPRKGEHVVVIFSNYADEPYDTKLEGVVEKVEWEINSRRQHQETDSVYASVFFKGKVKAQPYKE